MTTFRIHTEHGTIETEWIDRDNEHNHWLFRRNDGIIGRHRDISVEKIEVVTP